MIIPFLAFCLVATCNAELRTWTAVNGKEVEAEFVSNEKGIVKLKLKSGKVFEVPANKLSKEDNEFIGSLAKPDGVNRKELEVREGILYLKGSDTPLTGKVYEFHPNGQKAIETSFKDGKANGLQTKWHENGQKKSERNLNDGTPDGLIVLWDSNGRKQIEWNMKDGKKEGLEVWWYENGQKLIETNYKDDKEDGVSTTWYKDGQKQFEENFKDGELISAKFWNSKGEPVDSEEEAK